MRAAVIERVGEGPALRDVDEPERGEGEALIAVAAAPLNPIDLSIAAGRFYGGAPDVPYVPGREGLGHVVEGDALSEGSRIWFTAGARGGGGSLAERVAVDEQAAVPVPDGVDDALAACLGIAGLAGWLALEWRAELRRDETVLVLGASGPVGQVAVQGAKLLGAGRVVAAARDHRGLERARELGADAVVDLSSGEDPERLGEAFRNAAGGDVDVTVDPLWGEPAVAAAHAAAQGGRIVQLGQSAAPEATLPSALVRGKLLSILGHTNFAAPRDVQATAYRRIAEHAAAGRLVLDHEVLPLDEVAAAWERQAAFPRRKLVLAP